MSEIGVGVASKLAGSTPYVTASLETATLYKYIVLLLRTTSVPFSLQLERDVYDIPTHADTPTFAL